MQIKAVLKISQQYNSPWSLEGELWKARKAGFVNKSLRIEMVARHHFSHFFSEQHWYQKWRVWENHWDSISIQKSSLLISIRPLPTGTGKGIRNLPRWSPCSGSGSGKLSSGDGACKHFDGCTSVRCTSTQGYLIKIVCPASPLSLLKLGSVEMECIVAEKARNRDGKSEVERKRWEIPWEAITELIRFK